MKMHDVYKKYLSGDLEKHKYIDIMYKKHQILFEYYDYIKDTDIESITIGADYIYVSVRGSNIKLLIDRFDRRFIPIEILNFHSIDPQERDLLFESASFCPTIFDVGANIGWYTLSFAKIPTVRKVYAFEPIEHTYNYLKKHVEINRIQNASIYNFGFSDTVETKPFFWTKNENGSASMANIQERHHIVKTPCSVTTIDTFMKNRRNAVDLIKCDVEGAELFVFKGAINTLRKHRPVIFTEALRKWSKKFGYHPDDIINLLTDLGYCCFGYVDKKIEKIDYVSSELGTTNFFFFHEDKHRKFIDAKCL
jgi:FkbM family methyltransferase